jgi:hypothetical protein
MDTYKITNIDHFMDKPLELYNDLYNEKIKDPAFNLYKFIDLEMGKEYEIFCISDIHADIHRFWTFLYLQNFVTSEHFTSLDDIVWNPQITHKALVICGDLIDGRRPPNENLNSTPNNEIILHIIIYNLRIEAIKHKCYIFCTLGNHDFYAFHKGNPKWNFAYIDYIDSKSKKNYINQLEDRFYNIENIKYNDKLYLSRTLILSRFYLIGFPFFLKINKTLFAHAGFHKSENIIALFDNGQNSNNQVQPLLIHRKMLEYMSDPHNIVSFIEFNKRDKKRVPDYSSYYTNLFELSVLFLHRDYDKKNISNAQLIEKYSNYFTNDSEDSMIFNLFLTRELQKNCAKVDEILQTYGCHMLVLGHCPTCFTTFFNSENVSDIKEDCTNARIVYSCEGKLITVDIASSSGFTPVKDFLECLSITIDKHNIHRMKTVNYNLITGVRTEYNNLSYNKDYDIWSKPILRKNQMFRPSLG